MISSNVTILFRVWVNDDSRRSSLEKTIRNPLQDQLEELLIRA